MQEKVRTHGLILGIESSCDETAAAVVRRGREVLSNVVASQMQMHALYGGVVPELASREHLRNITPVVREAMAASGARLEEVDAVAVTSGPGLAGALLVGISYAKSLAFALGKPLIAVNHLEGHIHAVLMQQAEQEEGPTLALVVSGGHTHLYLAHATNGVWRYRNVGRTVDDAAGEAYDKVAKLLGLGYPGGPWIDTLATYGNPKAVPFRFQEIRRRDADPETPSFDFSFSGIKTAVLRYTETHAMKATVEERRKILASQPDRKPAEAVALLDSQTLDLIASFQHAVVGNLVRQAMRAAAYFGAKTVLVTGGVAANRALRLAMTRAGEEQGVATHFPQIALSTDNAAMIAAAAWPHFLAGESATETLNATPQLRLG